MSEGLASILISAIAVYYSIGLMAILDYKLKELFNSKAHFIISFIPFAYWVKPLFKSYKSLCIHFTLRIRKFGRSIITQFKEL